MAAGWPLSARRRGSHGAAALEFAIVMPIMVALFGGLLSFGTILWSQYQLGLLTAQTARTCVAMQASLAGNAASSLQACATQQFTVLYNQTSAKMCDQPPQVTPVATPLGASLASGRQAYLLKVQATCQKNYFPLLNVYTRANLTSAKLKAQSAMPFLP
jgi:hypothetical protein